LKREGILKQPGPSRVAPNLVLAGAQRSGTTFLKANLSRHPQIGFMPNSGPLAPNNPERTGFPFTSPALSQAFGGTNGERYWYRNLASETGDFRYIGTKWPYFMVWPHCIANMRSHLPEASIVIVLRDPVEVTWSAFRKSYVGRHLVEDFRDRVAQGLTDLQNVLTGEHRAKWSRGAMGRSSAAFELDRNFFAPQVQLVCDLFPETKRHFLRFSDLIAKPSETVRSLIHSLGLDPGAAIDFGAGPHNSSDAHNPASAGVQMLEETREALEAFYLPSNVHVAKLLDWPGQWWA
jgi:hypothetical protein